MRINLVAKQGVWIGAVFLLLFAGSAIAAAESMEDGVAAVEKQDYLTAYRIFKKLAEQGDPVAQHNLAVLYKQGKGVMQDIKLAVSWFQKAADQGLPAAQYYLGHLYDTGQGVEKDPRKAVQWYKIAAEKGDPLAQTNLGVSYANGEGIKQDIILAYVWFSLAASQGVNAAFENRNELKKDMSEALIANAQRLTREYFKKYIEPFQPEVSEMMQRHSQGSNPHAAGAKMPPVRLPPGHIK